MIQGWKIENLPLNTGRSLTVTPSLRQLNFLYPLACRVYSAFTLMALPQQLQRTMHTV